MRFILFSFILFITSCSTPTAKEVLEEKPQVSQTVYAKHFRFSTKDNQKVVEIINPDTKKVVSTLFPLGTNKMNCAFSATIIGMLQELDLASSIVGVQEMKYIYNHTVKDNYKNGKIIEAGYETQLTIEPIIAAKPALILYNGFNTDFPHQKQFEAVGIQCVPIFDWREETPLGRAEWIKIYGFLYGKLDEATRLFDEISKKYNQLKEKAKKLHASELVMSGNMMGSEWYSPAGQSFYAQFLKDANITYAYADSKGTGSIANTLENYLTKNRHATIWINAGAKSLKELIVINPKANLFDAFQNNQVYCYSPNDNFYWEMSSIEPDKLLNDLIQITHPEEKQSEKLYFYSRLK